MECAFLTALILVKITLPKISGIPMIAQVGKTSFRLPGFAGDNIEFHLTLKNNLNNYIFVFDAIIKNQYHEIIARIHDIKGVNNTHI